ncbi:MAG: metallophosphoesterase [Crenarchaeota archaeon]|nr:metallophosphoesterase [Thermoproteota archaeon]
MRILATADIHSPKYLKKFERLINIYKREIEILDIVLIAGDLMEKGNIGGLRQLVSTIRKVTQAPIYACPGNEDYDETVEKAKTMIRDVRWIIDEKIEVEHGGQKLCIVGSKGVLDKPTPWQTKHIRNIEEIYRRRLELLIRLIESLNESSINILLLHYAPTYRTLEGENSRIWCYLGTSKLESYISNRNLITVHGHAHRSRKRIVKLGRSIIINAAFPEIYDLYIIDVLPSHVDVTILKSSGEIVKFEPIEDVKRRGSSILDYV